MKIRNALDLEGTETTNEEGKTMTVTELGRNRWSVLSDTSGKTYTVRLRTRLDECGSMYFRWECDCPSRKTCKHIRVVEEATSAVDAQAEERVV